MVQPSGLGEKGSCARISTMIEAYSPSGSRSGSNTVTVIPRYRESAARGVTIVTRSSAESPGEAGQSTAGMMDWSTTSTSRYIQKRCSGTLLRVSWIRVPIAVGPMSITFKISIRLMAVSFISGQAKCSSRPSRSPNYTTDDPAPVSRLCWASQRRFATPC